MSYMTTAEEIGWEQGRQEGERAALFTLLGEKFPDISPQAYEEKLKGESDVGTLLQWIKKALKAETLADVFGERKP